MDLEEPILLYYLKSFSLIILILILFLIKIFFYDKIDIKSNTITINKNHQINQIIKENFNNTNKLENIFYTLILKMYNNNIRYIHYGEFKIIKNITFFDFVKLISNPGNKLKKITIIEGWNSYQLNELINKHFNDTLNLKYQEIIADTYHLESNGTLDSLKLILEEHKSKLLQKYSNHLLLKKYSFEEIIIIASLIEKEAIDEFDKKMISSVIFNRLEKKMRLQIDASVIFAITNGYYKFDRNLTLKDLKIQNNYNTYFIKALPPGPICYVGTKTIEIIFENYKSDYFYYFYNKFRDEHIYSETYDEHLKKLYEYRKKIK